MFLRTILITFLFATTHLFIAAQNDVVNQTITISGKVVDGATNIGIPYVAIGIENKAIGTITNSEGDFEFHFYKKQANEVVYFSMMGYITYTIKVEQIKHRNFIIHLQKSPYVLKEYVVSQLTANQVMKRAIEAIPKNYPSKPYIIEGFYRNFRKQDKKCVSLVEAAVKIYDTNCKAPYRVKQYKDDKLYLKKYMTCPVKEQVYIDEIRKSYNYQTYNKGAYFNTNSLVELLKNNRVKYRNWEVDTARNKYQFEEQINLNNRSVYVIRNEKRGNDRVYVAADNFAILKVENYSLPDSICNYELSEKGDKTKKDRYSAMKLSLEFKEFQGKMYLNHLLYSWGYDVFNDSTKTVVAHFDVSNELIINNIIINNVKNVKKSLNSVSKHKSLEQQSNTYHAAFWGNYNMVKQTPLNQKLVEDLEKGSTLKEQFGGLPKN